MACWHATITTHKGREERRKENVGCRHKETGGKDGMWVSPYTRKGSKHNMLSSSHTKKKEGKDRECWFLEVCKNDKSVSSYNTKKGGR